MRIAIFGTGGVGGYFGGRLAQAGEEVIFIARGEHLRAIRENGLRVDSIKGDFVVRPARASADSAEVGPVDVVIVAVKAWQVPETAEAMRPLVGPSTMVVPLLNGVEAAGQLAAILGSAHVIGGLCAIISMVAGPGYIRHIGAEPQVVFGELDNRPSERVEQLRGAFARCQGLGVTVPPDIHVAIWRKFLFIAPVSGIGSVTRLPMGHWRHLPETRQMLVGAMQEILAVAQARDIALTEEAITDALALLDANPPTGTSSMQRDIAAGQPSELEVQNGAVVRLGREVDVATPIHSFLYASLLPAERQARNMG